MPIFPSPGPQTWANPSGSLNVTMADGPIPSIYSTVAYNNYLPVVATYKITFPRQLWVIYKHLMDLRLKQRLCRDAELFLQGQTLKYNV